MEEGVQEGRERERENYNRKRMVSETKSDGDR